MEISIAEFIESVRQQNEHGARVDWSGQEKPKHLGRNQYQYQCHFFHHKYDMDWPRTKPVTPQ
jgi:hypothetical protein